jgi:hypothetical protein
MGGDEDPLQAKPRGQGCCEEPPRTAEGNERLLARVDAPLDGDATDGALGRGEGNLDDAVRDRGEVEAEPGAEVA